MRYLAAVLAMWVGLCMSEQALLIDQDTVTTTPTAASQTANQEGEATLVCTYWSGTDVFESVHQDIELAYIDEADCPTMVTASR